MTNPFTESATDDVLYPDDLPGRKFVLLSDGPVKAKNVDKDDAKYGHFVKVRDSSSHQLHMSAPKALRKWIGENYDELTDGTPFEIESVDRGPNDHDPYVIEARLIHEGDPL